MVQVTQISVESLLYDKFNCDNRFLSVDSRLFVYFSVINFKLVFKIQKQSGFVILYQNITSLEGKLIFLCTVIHEYMYVSCCFTYK